MKGSTEPRIYTPPLRELTPDTSLGFALATFARDILDEPLLPWQEWLAIHALELNEEGGFRFRTVLTLVGRQNGKTTFAKTLSDFFLAVLGCKVVLGTAQNVDTANETWENSVADFETNPALKPLMVRTLRGAGNRILELTDNRRYKVAAANRKGGRGLSCDLILMDELREQTDWEAWAAITKTTNARPNAIVWCMSNAGDAKSVVLKHLRQQAHSMLGDPDGITTGLELQPGDDVDTTSLGLFEWSAEPDCITTDKRAWAAANPSMGYGFLTERALDASQKTDPEAVFRTECLCQWVTAKVPEPFPDGSWDAGIDPTSYMEKGVERYFGLDVSADRRRTTIAVCGQRPDLLWHIEVVASNLGTGWAIDWLRKRCLGGKVSLAIQGRGAPVASYIADLSAIDNLELTLVEGRDLGAMCGRFWDGIAAATQDSDAVAIMHRPQPILDEPARTAQKRGVGDSAWMWDRGASPSDISPLVACTWAFGLATMGRTETRTSKYETAYTEARGLVVI